ncbi:UNVERIFIED_CONTAM: hypothetical protein PYX00_011543 [Menopon gallinae]|uniref:C2H2-type domain-containing protein n=1 Tax=Menopon gallinae TaxID=328185 RepID=A0AAW2H7Z8_9NEOP
MQHSGASCVLTHAWAGWLHTAPALCVQILHFQPTALFGTQLQTPCAALVRDAQKGEEAYLGAYLETGMRFVERVLFGEDLPKYSDQAVYPQTAHRRTLCLRKHCDSQCARGLGDEYKFWAHLLSLHPPDRNELAKHLCGMDEDLRTSMWNRLLRSSPSYQDNVVHDEEDRAIVCRVMEVCRSTDSECSLEREVFCIYKNILRFCDVGEADRDIMSLILHILRLPHADELVTFRVLYFFLYTLGYTQAFLDGGTRDLVCMLAARGVMPLLLDICVCFNLYFSDFQAYAADNAREDLNLHVQAKMERLLHFAMERYRPVEERNCHFASEGYFDFLVVQNESIKAHEDVKMRLADKIRQLEETNRELVGKNQNLVDSLETMEAELQIFNENLHRHSRRSSSLVGKAVQKLRDQKETPLELSKDDIGEVRHVSHFLYDIDAGTRHLVSMVFNRDDVPRLLSKSFATAVLRRVHQGVWYDIELR